jgi:hypothetical protein
MLKKIQRVFILLAVMLAMPSAVARAEGNEAYSALSEALFNTHRDGSFRIRGEATALAAETVNGTRQVNSRQYRITGHDLNAAETMLQFETLNTVSSTFISFLLKPEAVYVKEIDWKPADLTAVLPQFISMGILDQFFVLEILNSNRLHVYADYISFEEDKEIGGEMCRGIAVTVSRDEFAELAGKLTEDIPALLGDAAKGMSDFQLLLMQRFARGIFTGLQAEGSFTFYVQPATGRIVRIETRIDMANPYGSRAPGANPRVRTTSFWRLHDFGAEVKSISP